MITKIMMLLKKVPTFLLVFALFFSITAAGYAEQENIWNGGRKASYVPPSGVSPYEPSGWTKNLVDLYRLAWYEKPDRGILKGEFMLVQLRTIQASLERRNLTLLSAPNETLNFIDINTLVPAAQEETKILKSLGILSGTPDGYMKMNEPIKRSEAAKILAVTNSKVLNIPSIRTTKIFNDTIGHWSENSVSIAFQITLINGSSDTTFNPNVSLTLEQTLQILENEVGYFGITRADVAKAMNETFKVTLDTTVSNGMITKDSYVKYEEKMETYGFCLLYNNRSSKSSETVTKAEAIKLALGVIFNAYDENTFGYIFSGITYYSSGFLNNVDWIDFANSKKLLEEEVNVQDYNEPATYIDVISLFERCKIEFLKDYPVRDDRAYLKDMEAYSTEEQKAIKDMLANGIIYPVADALKGSAPIFKGQLNELVVNFAERYSTIALSGEKVVTDPAKLPSNAYLFPYISSNVDRQVYEITPLKSYYTNNTPKDMYMYFKMEYPQAKKHVEEGFYAILNVDYRTITEENFLKGVKDYFVFPPTESMIKYYVNYVKNNKIILKGRAEFQSPITYRYDGFMFSRVKLNFEILNSDTKYNLIFLDFYGTNNIIYQKMKFEVLADISLDRQLKSFIFYLKDEDLYKRILDRENSGIIMEE